MITPEQRKELEKKLNILKKAQEEAYEHDLERLHLNKVTKDKNWMKYVARAKKRLQKYYAWEYRNSRRTYRAQLMSKKSF